MKVEFFGQSFDKSSSVKFHEIPSSGSRVVRCGRTDGPTDGRRQTYMTKLIVAFRNFANAPKNGKKGIAVLAWFDLI
jgi:hypothetical protein